MFTAREKEIQLYQTWQFHSIFPAPSQGARTCLSLPLPIHAHPLCHDCQESVPIVSGTGTPVNWELN